MRQRISFLPLLYWQVHDMNNLASTPNSTFNGRVFDSPTSDNTPKQKQNWVPIWEKYTLTIEEAAVYFRIGESKLRRIVNENPDANYILWNGNRIQIKRKLFESYIDLHQVI